MQIYDVLEAAQGGQAMANLGASTGITEEQARTAARTVMPELAFALERNTLSRGGLADLVEALGHGHHEQILDMPQAWSDPRVVADGDAILMKILGSPGKVATLSDQAQRAAGIPDGILRMLLPILAQLLMGAIARSSKGGLGDILSRLPIPGGGQIQMPGGGGMARPSGGGASGGGFELPRMDRPQGGFPMPSMPGETAPAGNPRRPTADADEQPTSGSRGGFGIPWPSASDEQQQPAPRQSGGFGLPQTNRPQGGFPMPPMPQAGNGGGAMPTGSSGGFPFPLPQPRTGGDNPYGDLSDILRRSRASLPAGTGNSAGGGMLWSIVRNVLGGALGFGGRGVFGWIIQLLVVRWGWGLLRRKLFGR